MALRTFRLDPIQLRDLTALDLRREAVQLQWMTRDETISREDEDEILADISTQEPFAQFPALAYRVTIEGEAMTADVLVATETARVGIAWGADAVWLDIHDACDLTTEAGGDAFAAALHAAVERWLMDDDGDDLVGTATIARLAGVQPATVQAWTERHESFPAPVQTFGATRVWRWGDVAEWLAVPRPTGRPRKS